MLGLAVIQVNKIIIFFFFPSLVWIRFCHQPKKECSSWKLPSQKYQGLYGPYNPTVFPFPSWFPTTFTIGPLFHSIQPSLPDLCQIFSNCRTSQQSNPAPKDTNLAIDENYLFENNSSNIIYMVMGSLSQRELGKRDKNDKEKQSALPTTAETLYLERNRPHSWVWIL